MNVKQSFPLFSKPELAKKIKAMTGYTPKDLGIYKLALRHASAYPYRKKRGERNNERLEFLGDAVLDVVVAECLFLRLPEEDEGTLTKSRSKIVSRYNLNKVADRLGLPNLLVSKLNGAKSESIYGDALEALVGAIYLDQGMRRTERFIIKEIIDPFLDHPEWFSKTHNYKSEIIEHFQKEKISFRFDLIEQHGEQHNAQFTMGLYIGDKLVATGDGSSKKKGEESASRHYYEEFLNEKKSTNN